MIYIYRHIISMKSEGYVEAPQDIVEEYNGCSVPQYTAYRLLRDTPPHSVPQPTASPSSCTVQIRLNQGSC